MGVEASPADIPKFGWDDHSSNVNVVEDAYVLLKQLQVIWDAG